MKFILIFFLLFSLLFSGGCASLRNASPVSNTSSILEIENGVEFTANKPQKMTYKKGDAEYTFDSQAESWISKILSVLSIGWLGTKK